MTSKPQPQSVLRFYWRHVTRYPRYWIPVSILLPVTIFLNSYLPTLVLANVLSRLSGHHYTGSNIWQNFGEDIVLYGGSLLIGLGLWRAVDFCVWRLETGLSRDMANEVFNHLLAQSADFHANKFAGSLVSQTNKLLTSYVRLQDTFMFQTYPMIAGIVIAAVIVAPRAPLFSLALIVFSLLFVALAVTVSGTVRRKGAQASAAESKQTGYLADAIGNVMAIKSFAGGDYERQRFYDVTEHTRKTMRQFAKTHQMQMNVLGTTTRLISAASLLVAVIGVMRFHANVSTVYLIFSYTAYTVDSLFQFGNNGLRNYNRATGDAGEMVEILAQMPSILDPAKPEASRIRRGDIVFDKVTFQHAGASSPIFQDLQLHIKAGEKVGLVGHSGSGKTTFTRLLLRFSDIGDGEIRIDGQNIAAITQDDLHRAIAYVPQEPLLFHRTIRENIAYGAEASDEAIVGAAKRAHAAEFIELLPEGYDTLVGERGVKLSGGQRQRIAIARAMLKNAPILVLDEATSALDSESEVLIQDALWKLMEGRTAIVIAHRLSTIQKMDRIVVMDDGQVVEQGTHKELIRQDGQYAKLWAHQSGGFIDER